MGSLELIASSVRQRVADSLPNYSKEDINWVVEREVAKWLRVPQTSKVPRSKNVELHRYLLLHGGIDLGRVPVEVMTVHSREELYRKIVDTLV